MRAKAPFYFVSSFVISLNLPYTIYTNEFEIKMIVASTLFEEGRLSSGQAAEIVGITKKAFIELLGKYGVSVFGYDSDELTKDLSNI